MRFPRVKATGHGYYHCISRVVEGRFIFATSGPGSIESERFTKLMRCLEAFSGVRVLTYVLMSNHFHLLCEVPEPISLTEVEVLKRIEAGYGKERLQSVQEELARCCQQPDGSVQIQRLLDGYRKRMYDLSVFIKELKGRFAQWYNQRHERYGVLWAERFKSVLLDEQALPAVAAYIELNPVRAGLCADPKDYRYSGYGEALAKGSRLARHGIRTILGQSETMCWQRMSQEYRKFLFIKGSLGSAEKRPAFDLATVRHVVEQQRGELPLPHLLLCRIRYFTDGVILGSQGFVQSHYDRLKQQLGYKRQRTPKHLDTTGSAGLWVFRDPRVRAVH